MEIRQPIVIDDSTLHDGELRVLCRSLQRVA